MGSIGVTRHPVTAQASGCASGVGSAQWVARRRARRSMIVGAWTAGPRCEFGHGKPRLANVLTKDLSQVR